MLVVVGRSWMSFHVVIIAMDTTVKTGVIVVIVVAVATVAVVVVIVTHLT